MILNKNKMNYAQKKYTIAYFISFLFISIFFSCKSQKEFVSIETSSIKAITPPTKKVKNIILLIGDGMGVDLINTLFAHER